MSKVSKQASSNNQSVVLTKSEQRRISTLQTQCKNYVKNINTSTRNLIKSLRELYNTDTSQNFDKFMSTLYLEKSYKSKVLKIVKCKFITDNDKSLPVSFSTRHLIASYEDKCQKLFNSDKLTSKTSRSELLKFVETKKKSSNTDDLLSGDYVSVSKQFEDDESWQDVIAEVDKFITRLEKKLCREFNNEIRIRFANKLRIVEESE